MRLGRINSVSTLLDLSLLRAETNSKQIAYTFLKDGDLDEAHLANGELDSQSRAIAAVLQQSLKAGDRALILCPPGFGYITAFFGCVYAGVVAVPAYPPRLNRHLERIRSIAADARPAAVLTTSQVLRDVQRHLAEAGDDLAQLRWICVDEVADAAATDWRLPKIDGESLAFLQYTSGSTAVPKGVMLSHRNLLANLSFIQKAFESTTESRGVIWLPPYHDMGLIGGILQPLYVGFPVTLMAPVAFLQRPARWLEAISRYRATSSGGPNFAYDLCVRQIPQEQREALDLSSWKVAFNGAEPVMKDTLDRFFSAFAGSGFRREAFYPCYGLAEATLLVTGGKVDAPPVVTAISKTLLEKGEAQPPLPEEPEDRRELVGSGQGMSEQQVRILNPSDLTPCAEGTAGEIWVAGPSVAAGYWDRGDETAATFHAYDAAGVGPFLRTGDLGFLQGEELFVTGRLKDLIIIRGRNHYPQDIELTVGRCDSALLPGGTAAFAIEVDDEERLVVVQEVTRGARKANLEPVVAAIRQAVALEHDLQVHAVVLIMPSSIPKTSSGKIQRRATRAEFLEGTLSVVWSSSLGDETASADAETAAATLTELPAGGGLVSLATLAGKERQRWLERYLIGRLSRLLRVRPERIECEAPLISLGLDSLQAVELKYGIETEFGITLAAESLLEDASVASLAAYMVGELKVGSRLAPAGPAAYAAARGELEPEVPLSHVQHRMWFMEQLNPGTAAYHIPVVVRLSGPLDAILLGRSLQELVRRHEVLRTAFVMGDSAPQQVIHPEVELPFQVVDGSGMLADELRQLIAAEAARPFDLSRAPLVRTTLYRMGPADHLLQMTVHHMIADGWSMGVFARELSALYRASGTGETLPLLRAQYRDYVVWHRQVVEGEQAEEQLRYWKQQLAGAPATLELPADRVRPPVRTTRGAVERFELPGQLVEKLQALSRRHRVTLHTTLLTAFKILLHRYSGQTDLLVGTPVHGRNHADVDGLIGLFVGTQVIRTQLSGDQSFTAVLAQVRETVRQALAHQDVPFERLVDELVPERSLSHTPLIQVMFAYQGDALRDLRFPGVDAEVFPLDMPTAQFDLTLNVTPAATGFQAAFEYSTDLFDAATVARMSSHFEGLLAGIVSAPDTPVGAFAMLSPAEEQHLLVALNQTAREFPRTVCVHQLVEAQAAKAPHAVALRWLGGDLTYRQLNRRANQVAHYLRHRGVGPDMPVAVFMDRNPDMVAGWLGVLKAGGAYVPLDTTHPPRRVADMLADAGVQVVLSQQHLAPTLAECGVEVVCVDGDEADGVKQQPETELPTVGGPQHLAYIIYTSGSTGTPKGVEVEHASLVNLVCWMMERYELTPESRASHVAGVAFDASGSEVWPVLCSGGTLCLPDDETRMHPERLRDWLLAEGVTVAYAPTTMAEALMGLEWPPVSDLRYIFTGGEKLRRYPPETLPFVVADSYGPTEATIIATSTVVQAASDSERLPNIGRPLHNTTIYLLDGQLKPVPVGVPGELYIGGVGVARGYRNRPDLTAERFLPDPFSGRPGARLYRTGDLARYLPDGNIDFLGRADAQVKVRGFRIELGEIEAHLRRHPTLADVCVVVREDEPGVKRLVAYLVAPGIDSPSGTELRTFLKQYLPDYMVPAAFVTLKQLPLTPNGKVDRRALPAPDRMVQDRQTVDPRTPTEVALAEIWQQVLKVEKVSIDDHFFDMGGHSLLATQLTSRVRSVFGMELPVRTLFEWPTVAGLATVIDAARQQTPVAQAASALVATARPKLIPLSYAQQRLWFLDQLEPGSAVYNMPGLVRFKGQLNVAALSSSLGEVLRRHEILRTRFEVESGTPWQVVDALSPYALAPDDLSGEPDPEAELRRLADHEARRPFDLAQGPVFRARLFRLGDEEHVLLVNMHHIVSDGWSIGILIRELTALYRASIAGAPSPLADLPLQYGDFAQWQRQWLQGEVLEQQIAFWQELLGTDIPILELPSDRPRPAVPSYRGATHAFRVSHALAERLKGLALQEGATLFMVLMAAFQTLLHRYSGQRKILVGTPVANRNHKDTEALLGFFVNTLVLPADVSDNATFRTLLARVRSVALDAYAHQDVPFEKLTEVLQPERALNHAPLVQSMFVLQNTPEAALELPGLTVSVEPLANGVAKFDLTLSVTEEPEGFAALFEYSTDLFDRATMERMAEHLLVLLDGVTADPNRPVSQLPLLTEAERHQVLVTWNQTARDDVPVQVVHQQITAVAAATPDALAVRGVTGALTYRQLNQGANQVAHFLRNLGVGPDVPVAVYMERSPAMVTAWLGILKAGGAYLPLDPAHPPQRLTRIVADAGVAVVLTQAHLAPFMADCGAKVVAMDGDQSPIGGQPETDLPNVAGPRNLVYVIYTSGSTGTPKGVEVEHGSLLNMVHWQHVRYGLTARTRASHCVGVAFDAAGTEIWPVLCAGGTLCLPDEETRLSPARLQAWLLAEGVTIAQVSNTTVEALMQMDWPPETPLRHLLTGGEKFRRYVPKPLPFTVVDNYGPTETTIITTCAEIPGVGQREGLPHIGRPICNAAVYILDGELQPVPIGVPGEIYIGGAGVGRGYRNRPDLTAERFIPDPFSGQPGARLYRTGDLARFLPNGNIDFSGRADEQVKIRGFRIELGEVQSALEGCAEVARAVVMVREDQPGNRELVAYLIPTEGRVILPVDLRSYLKERLPEYMVPAAFVALQQFPLTPNDKVDVQALPAPSLADRGASVDCTAPRTETEQTIARVWAELLGLKSVGVHDSFFDLGGHSLLATQAISRLRELLGVDLPLRSLFTSPTVAALAKVVDGMSGGVHYTPIPVADRTQPLPASFAQYRMWFLNQLEPESPVYNIPGGIRMAGSLDLAALEGALSAMVRRHESLRTTFAAYGGEAVQVPADDLAVDLPVFDLTHLAPGAREQELALLAAVEAKRPFDLQHGPLFRTTLLRLAETDHVLLLTMHHIISDGWSMGVFVREVTALYDSLTKGQQILLPPLPVQYADFAVWHRDQAEAQAEQLAYWQEQLDGAPQVLNLPTDRPRPAVNRYRGRTNTYLIDGALLDRIKSVARAHDATLFMTVMAGFFALLHRYTGQDDILVGTPVANRTRQDLEGIIGCFINTLVLRCRLEGDPTFGQLLQQVHETALAAYANQDVPFEQVVEAAQTERSLSYSPLFQVLFVLQNAPMQPVALTGLTVSTLEPPTDTAKFDLTVGLLETPEGLRCSFTYNTDLFDSETIDRLATHFKHLLAGATLDPACRVSELPLLTDAEREQVLVAWNDTGTEIPHESRVHRLFEMQADLTPDRIAVSAEGVRLTFAELNTRANRLANHLQRAGVGPDQVVGIAVDRSADMLVGILGVLKAGGAYLPLDPAYPEERLTYIMTDARVSVLLGRKAQAGHLPVNVLLDGDAWADEPDTAPYCDVSGENLAYVIYTSGSTGTPKGVMVRHAAVANLHHALRQTVYEGVVPASLCVGLNAPLTFDSSVKQLIQVLDGHTLAILPQEFRMDPRAWLAYVAEERIDAIDCTPAQLKLLLENGLFEANHVPSLMLIGGEAIDPATWTQLAQAERTRFFNVYGPTECTVDATVCRVDPIADRPVIGRALHGVQTYVLDRHLQPVPIGVPGELCIGGAGVARGYVGAPDLTAARFVPDPFGPRPGARMYRTGDLARFLPDGTIEFLGRIDHQVKIRGFRIELGEVEAVLTRHPAVAKAVVMVREDQPGQRRLVGYVVPVAGATPKRAEFQTFLREHLPDYMVPEAYVCLDAIPVTAHGKVDRRALPAPADAAGDGYVAPRTPAEEILAGIWAEVLGRERVGAHDNFFELGGHSLLLTRVASRTREVFAVELPLQQFFAAATLAQLAQFVSEAALVQVPPIRRVARGGDLPLSFAQQRLWFLDQLQPDSPFYNLPGAFRLEGSLNVEALGQSLTEIVRRHEALRTTFAVADGKPVQVIGPAEPLVLPVTDLTSLAPQERERAVQRLATEESGRPFNLARGPLLRFSLLRLAPEEHVLLVTLHHIVADGWSDRVLISELTALYQAFVSGQPSPLPDLPIQYADYAVWQRQWLQGEVLARQLEYWRQQLGKGSPVLQLPTDRPRPAVQSFRGAVHHFAISAPLAAQLRHLSRQLGATLFMTLLASFQLLLARYAGQEDISVGVPIANRNRLEIEGLIGFFVNTLVMRTDLSGAQTFRELLARVQRAALGAYANQDLPFEQLVEEMQPARDVSHTPFFQVAFAYQNVAGESIAVQDLRVRPLTLESRTARFDLTLGINDSGEEMVGTWEFNTDLFDVTTIERMQQHLLQLLAGIVANPDAMVGTLPLLTEPERTRMLVDWNRPKVEFLEAVCIHQLVARQAAERPDGLAVESAAGTLTYGQLNRRANQLAHYLRSRGVGPEVTVGVYVDRTPDLLVAHLGVMKSGGAYVPLDPAYPLERLSQMLDDAGVALVLTQEPLLKDLSGTQHNRVCLDTEWATIARESDADPEELAGPHNLVDIVYTSGSTGTPKGVEVEHRSLLSFALGYQKLHGHSEQDRVGLNSGLAFDALCAEVWPSLISGATLCLPEQQTRLSPQLMQQWLLDRRVTMSFVPTSVAERMMLLPWPTQTPLRTLHIGGDKRNAPVPPGLPFQVMDHYGPTEITAAATAAVVTAAGEMHIGRPFGAYEVYLLDKHGQPVPVGVQGEMFIGGPGVARGYRNRPDLTAERFLPHPFASGLRIYRTGDYARYLPDGNIEFLGRMDHQVKLRGFRIELGEIESVLGSHPDVHQAVVVVREDEPGEKRLVAYVVPMVGKAMDGRELRRTLREKLPEYMVPSALVPMESLPLTPNEKIDRKALPAPETVQVDGESDFEAPRTPEEEHIAALWAELLRTTPAKVGVYQNFFDLGGHSLLATQVTSRLSGLYEVDVPLVALFQAGTVAGLAEALLLKKAEQQDPAELDRLLAELEAMSDEEALARLHAGKAYGAGAGRKDEVTDGE